MARMMVGGVRVGMARMMVGGDSGVGGKGG